MTLYSIGTSNRNWRQFLDPLLERGVRIVHDVRSRPYSRFAHFNRPKMEAALATAGVDYCWRGDALGGLAEIEPSDIQFRGALQSIVSSSEIGPAAYFCSEGDPANCHRAWTVGAEILRTHQVSTLNILRDDSLEPIEQTLTRIRRKAIRGIGIA